MAEGHPRGSNWKHAVDGLPGHDADDDEGGESFVSPQRYKRLDTRDLLNPPPLMSLETTPRSQHPLLPRDEALHQWQRADGLPSPRRPRASPSSSQLPSASSSASASGSRPALPTTARPEHSHSPSSHQGRTNPRSPSHAAAISNIINPPSPPKASYQGGFARSSPPRHYPAAESSRPRASHPHKRSRASVDGTDLPDWRYGPQPDGHAGTGSGSHAASLSQGHPPPSIQRAVSNPTPRRSSPSPRREHDMAPPPPSPRPPGQAQAWFHLGPTPSRADLRLATPEERRLYQLGFDDAIRGMEAGIIGTPGGQRWERPLHVTREVPGEVHRPREEARQRHPHSHSPYSHHQRSLHLQRHQQERPFLTDEQAQHRRYHPLPHIPSSSPDLSAPAPPPLATHRPDQRAPAPLVPPGHPPPHHAYTPTGYAPPLPSLLQPLPPQPVPQPYLPPGHHFHPHPYTLPIPDQPSSSHRLLPSLDHHHPHHQYQHQQQTPRHTTSRAPRQQISCYPCREGKLRCNGERPCSSCVKRGTVERCEFAKEVKRRGKGKRARKGTGKSGSADDDEEEEMSEDDDRGSEGSMAMAEGQGGGEEVKMERL